MNRKSVDSGIKKEFDQEKMKIQIIVCSSEKHVCEDEKKCHGNMCNRSTHICVDQLQHIVTYVRSCDQEECFL